MEKNIVRVRKSIDLSEETKRMLSYRAIRRGVSLKSYIETELERIAEEEEEEILHELSSKPEGIATGREKQEFVSYLNSLKK